MRLLTLSDIHFKETYSGKNFEDLNDVISTYFKSFKEKIEEINNEKPIDLVVLGGDIAFSGAINQYSSIRKILRKCLPKDVPVFSVVGNHEVNWTALSAAIGTNVELAKLFSIKKEQIVSSPRFQEVFSNYYHSFQSEINEGISYDFEHQFCTKKFAGYIYSKKDATLILLLNSAWYSFGPGVVQSFFNEWAKGKDLESLLKGLPNLLGDTLTQEGKQSYFFDSYPYFNEINEIISQDNEVKVVTFAHHPPSWLRWDELYTSDSHERNFNTLTDISQILITGHLHNPVMEPSLIRGKCYHVNNGIFLDYHFVDKYITDSQNNNPAKVFPNNWFNVIELNEEGFELIPYKFQSSKKSGKGVHYNYGWTKDNLANKFYNYPKQISEQSVIQAEKEKAVNKGKGSISIYNPKNIAELIELLRRQRSNEFENSDNRIKNIRDGEIVQLTGLQENYLIIINRLEHLFNVIRDAGTDYTKLKEDTLFKSLLEKLDSCNSNSLPVVAFYEIVDEINAKDKDAFEDFQQSKSIVYQSFKYFFFGGFEELHKFNELNIVFDTIVKKFQV